MSCCYTTYQSLLTTLYTRITCYLQRGYCWLSVKSVNHEEETLWNYGSWFLKFVINGWWIVHWSIWSKGVDMADIPMLKFLKLWHVNTYIRCRMVGKLYYCNRALLLFSRSRHSGLFQFAVFESVFLKRVCLTWE